MPGSTLPSGKGDKMRTDCCNTVKAIHCGVETGFGCGRVHQQSCPQPWRFFFAAYEGCRACVRSSMEQQDLYPASLKGFYRFISAWWPLLGAERGYDTMWVQGYLAGRGILPQPAAATAVCLASHDACVLPGLQGQPCELSLAAYNGCSICVQRLLDVEQVNPHIREEEQEEAGFNALAWARWGAAQGKATSWVQGFLEARGVKMSGDEQLPEVVDKEELERVLGADNSHGRAPAVI